MNYKLLYQWETELAAHLPGMNSWQIENMALFSYGIVRAESCQQGAVARQVNCGERVESTARRWRRFLDNERFPLARFFAEWSKWVVEALGSQEVTLLVDETKVHDRTGVMLVGVAWEGRCIPLAWRTYIANSKTDYPSEGQVKIIEGLLQHIKAGLSDTVKVLVLADRGIGTSPDLCRAVDALAGSIYFGSPVRRK